jgi:DNA polymerase-3 subunit delta
MTTAPFYLLEESEGYQEKRFLDSLKTPNTDILFFDLKEHKFDEVMESANTFSMFAKNRFITVQQHKDLKEKEEEELLKYIDAPNANTLIVWKTKKLDKRKKFSKQLQAKKILMSFTQPKPFEMGQWIDQIAKEVGVTVDRDAKGAIVEAVGCNLSQVERELEKIRLYIHPETKVLKKHIDEVVLKTSGDDVFAFTDQVINRDLKKAYPTLSHLMEEGTVPLVLLSMLVRHYRILLKVHDGLARRLPSAQLGGYAGVPPFLIQRYTDQAKKINMVKCRTSLKRLQKLDKEFKSTGLSNKILLEEAILKL